VDLSHAPVVEQFPAAHGVSEVDLPVVFRPDITQRGGDTAFGHHRVRLAEQRLAHEHRPRALGGGFDRRAQTGSAGADHQHIALVGLVLFVHQTKRTSVIAPVATRRTYRSARMTLNRLIQAYSPCRAFSRVSVRHSR
jgi:hypothetical protein